MAHQEATPAAPARDGVTHRAAPDGPRGTGAGHDAHHGPELAHAPARERGTTTIAERVVAKIAAQAAREALRRSCTLPQEAAGPHAVVVVRGGHAHVRIGLELPYPSDIGALCGAVRRRVGERLHALADLHVAEVAVQVERLHSAFSLGTAGRLR